MSSSLKIPLSLNALPEVLSKPLLEVEIQCHTNWCWSAVAVSIAKFYNAASVWTQCSLVNIELGQSDCCSDGGSDECNRQGSLMDALKRTMNFGLRSEGILDPTVVAGELKARRPIGVRLEREDLSAHFVAIVDFTLLPNGSMIVGIADPISGPLSCSLKELNDTRTAIGHVSHVYTTKA